MKVRLKNFKCYDDETFDFGDNGLALLSGSSGQGKSSIIHGIYFALFGGGTKVVSYGKSSCLVELEFDGLTISRTKRPNRLIVNDIYEDQAGQDIINNKFGDTFEVTGYVAQNALNSFILMSPIEKLAFLEKFAFKDINLGKIKGRCKALISERYDKMLVSISQLEMASKIIDELYKPEEVKFPIKCSERQQERVIMNEKIRHKNWGTLIKRSRNNVCKLQTELNSVKVLNASIEAKEEALESLMEKLTSLRLKKEVRSRM